jgi:type VI protein secretion system component VasK
LINAGYVVTPVVSGVTGAIEGASWIAGLITLVVASVLAVWAWDVRRAKGFGNWRREQAKASEKRAGARNKKAKLRQARKRRRLEGRLERRALRRGSG